MINAIISDNLQDSVFTFKDMDYASFDPELAKIKLKEYYANFFKNCPMDYTYLKLYFKLDITIFIKFIYEDDFCNYGIIKDCSFTLGSVLDEFKEEIMKNDISKTLKGGELNNVEKVANKKV